MKVIGNGQVSLRNDNPQNVVFKNDSMKPQELKELGNKFFEQNFYQLATDFFSQALSRDNLDQKLKVALLSNSS